MSDNNHTADKNMGSTTSNVVENEKEREDASPPERPEPRDEMLEAALEVVANSASFFARAGLAANLQQPLPTPPQRKITIHLVRHAEGPHNLTSIPVKERLDMLDPGLTRRGLAQAILLSKRFHAMDKLTHIVASPLRRTVHTALVGFKPAIKRGIQIVLCPDLRECGAGQCNTGTNIDDLLKDMLSIEDDVPKDCVDGSLCEPGWETDMEPWGEEDLRAKRVSRVQAMLYFLGNMAADASNDNVEIAVVTHSRLLTYLEGQTSEGDVYHNAEYRSYRITTDEEAAAGVNMFKLTETEESMNYVHTFPEFIDEE